MLLEMEIWIRWGVDRKEKIKDPHEHTLYAVEGEVKHIFNRNVFMFIAKKNEKLTLHQTT